MTSYSDTEQREEIMRTKFRTYAIPVLLTLLLTAASGCRVGIPASSGEVPESREPASLVLTTDLSAFITAEETRTGDADNQLFKHVTLFLIEYSENRLVAYRNIFDRNEALYPQEYNDTDAENGFVNEAGEIDPDLTSGKSVRVTFDYNNPKHGLAEKLTRGTYVLLAVANYEESDDFGNSGIAQKIEMLLDRFRKTPETGIDNFREDYADFYDLCLRIPVKTDNSGKNYMPYLRPSNVSIPLTCSRTLNLISGINRGTVAMEHTCARIRFDVRNYSDLELKVNSLTMSDNFAQSTCYLFSRLNTDENYKIEEEYYGKGAPFTTNENALLPFDPNRSVLKSEGPKTIFDGLIYESRDLTRNYTYTINVSYDGGDDYAGYALGNNGRPISELSQIAELGPYFLIRRRDTYSYLYVQNDKVYASAPGSGLYGVYPQQILDSNKEANYYNYLWELVPNGTSYYLRNVETGDYIQRIVSNSISGESARLAMVDFNQYADTFTTSVSENYFLFRSDYFQRIYYRSSYINVRENTNPTLVLGWDGTGEWSQFALYPVEQRLGLNTTREVVLQTIDRTSGVVSDVHEIRRNDYIQVMIGVTYNPDKGDFEFFVNDWETGGGDIEFN